MKLFRPTGPRELDLIAKSDYSAFPPRLPEQPIFYPVLNFEYAEQIARDWNSTNADTGYRGYVLEFDIGDQYAEHFEVQVVGGKSHQELWIPAEELGEMNKSILGKIRVVATYTNGERET